MVNIFIENISKYIQFLSLNSRGYVNMFTCTHTHTGSFKKVNPSEFVGRKILTGTNEAINTGQYGTMQRMLLDSAKYRYETVLWSSPAQDSKIGDTKYRVLWWGN